MACQLGIEGTYPRFYRRFRETIVKAVTVIEQRPQDLLRKPAECSSSARERHRKRFEIASIFSASQNVRRFYNVSPNSPKFQSLLFIRRILDAGLLRHENHNKEEVYSRSRSDQMLSAPHQFPVRVSVNQKQYSCLMVDGTWKALSSLTKAELVNVAAQLGISTDDTIKDTLKVAIKECANNYGRRDLVGTGLRPFQKAKVIQSRPDQIVPVAHQSDGFPIRRVNNGHSCLMKGNWKALSRLKKEESVSVAVRLGIPTAEKSVETLKDSIKKYVNDCGHRYHFEDSRVIQSRYSGSYIFIQGPMVLLSLVTGVDNPLQFSFVDKDNATDGQLFQFCAFFGWDLYEFTRDAAMEMIMNAMRNASSYDFVGLSNVAPVKARAASGIDSTQMMRLNANNLDFRVVTEAHAHRSDVVTFARGGRRAAPGHPTNTVNTTTLVVDSSSRAAEGNVPYRPSSSAASVYTFMLPEGFTITMAAAA